MQKKCFLSLLLPAPYRSVSHAWHPTVILLIKFDTEKNMYILIECSFRADSTSEKDDSDDTRNSHKATISNDTKRLNHAIISTNNATVSNNSTVLNNYPKTLNNPKIFNNVSTLSNTTTLNNTTSLNNAETLNSITTLNNATHFNTVRTLSDATALNNKFQFPEGLNEGAMMRFWTPTTNRNVRDYLRPEELTIVLRPRNKCSDNEELVVMVNSKIDNIINRNVIRNSWGKWLVESKPLNLKNDSVLDTDMKSRLFFLLGLEANMSDSSMTVINESRKFGDLIVENFVDTYGNLTLKTLFMLKYVKDHCPSAKFVMKIDDDTMLNVHLMKSVLKTSKLPDKLIFGFRRYNISVEKDVQSVWHIPLYLHDKDSYPSYVFGNSYIFSGNLVTPLLDVSLETPLFPFEDIYLTGILAEKLGVQRQHHDGFFLVQIDPLTPCFFKVCFTSDIIVI